MYTEEFDATARCWTGQALPDAKGPEVLLCVCIESLKFVGGQQLTIQTEGQSFADTLSLGYWYGSNFLQK